MGKGRYAVLGLVFFLFFLGGFLLAPLDDSIPTSNVMGGVIPYSASVCTTVTRVSGGVGGLGCSHNLLFNSGREIIEDYLGASGGSGSAVTKVVLCNASAGCDAPLATSAEAFKAFVGCGLDNATGSYSSNGVGNWTVLKTFTSTCNNMLTNVTRLQSANGTAFAGNSFTIVTLQNLDTITINWTISTN